MIANESVEAVVLPARGARLHRLRVFGHDVLRTPPDLAAYDREPFFWGSFVMAPWCNRIEAGPVTLGSQLVSVDRNFPDGSAIHGQVYDRSWEAGSDGVLRVVAGGDGWPWRYEVSQRATVGGQQLGLELGLTNLSDSPMPAGLGIHPWFRRPVLVAIRGNQFFSPNSDTAPEPVPVTGAHDLRGLQPMSNDLDATWTGLADLPVALRWPELGVEATIGATSAFVAAASPATIDAIAVEPETHAPQGGRRLRLGEPGALELIGPGQTLRLEVELVFDRVRRSS